MNDRATRLRCCRSSNRTGSNSWAITNVVKHGKQQIGSDPDSAFAVLAAHTAFLASRGAMGNLKCQALP